MATAAASAPPGEPQTNASAQVASASSTREHHASGAARKEALGGSPAPPSPGRSLAGALPSFAPSSSCSLLFTGHANVFARLQALFPGPAPSIIPPPPPRVNSAPVSASSAAGSSTGPGTRQEGVGAAAQLPPGPPPRSLKVRIVTWNMHESLPKVRRSKRSIVVIC